MKSQEDTVCVMVVYAPPESVIAAIEALLPQVMRVVVVDNGSNLALREKLGERVTWLPSPENNLARAQNLGIAKARALGADFVLLMDDDSLPPSDMVAQLRDAWRDGMGVVGPYLETGAEPRYIQARGRSGFRRVAFGEAPVLNNLFYVAASGSLIRLSILDNLGGMEEAFRLYFIDTEFCLRARRAGLQVVAAKAARMRHHFGKVTRHRLLGWEVTTTNHPPQARYFMFRNRKRLWRRYLCSDAGYVIFDMLRALSEVLRVMLFEQEKSAKLKEMLRGLLA